MLNLVIVLLMAQLPINRLAVKWIFRQHPPRHPSHQCLGARKRQRECESLLRRRESAIDENRCLRSAVSAPAEGSRSGTAAGTQSRVGGRRRRWDGQNTVGKEEREAAVLEVSSREKCHIRSGGDIFRMRGNREPCKDHVAVDLASITMVCINSVDSLWSLTASDPTKRSTHEHEQRRRRA